MNIFFENQELRIDCLLVKMPYPILDAFDDGYRVVVLLDPDSYLKDPLYLAKRRAGESSKRNLLAISYEGVCLWEAELPSDVDYYYKIVSKKPLVVNSFSSFVCEIDPGSGRISQKIFYK